MHTDMAVFSFIVKDDLKPPNSIATILKFRVLLISLYC